MQQMINRIKKKRWRSIPNKNLKNNRPSLLNREFNHQLLQFMIYSIWMCSKNFGFNFVCKCKMSKIYFYILRKLI